MRRAIIHVIMLMHLTAFAQDEEVHRSDSKIKGSVKKMHILGYMVRMVGDSLVYGEKWTDFHIEYDNKGRIKFSYSVPDNNIEDTIFYNYKYSDDGNVESSTIEHYHGKSVIRYLYVYQDGKLSELKIAGKNNDYRIEEQYVYYKDSTEKTYFTIPEHTRRYVYKYDDRNRIAQRDYYLNNLMYERIIYENDVFNNVIVSKRYLKGVPDDLYTYDYEYDSHHNFIKRTEYKYGNIYNITTRKIEYW